MGVHENDRPDVLTLEKVSEANFAGLWPSIKPLLVEVEDRSKGEFPSDLVVSQTAQGLWQMWAVLDADENVHALTVTEVTKMPGGEEVCNILIATGHERRKWVHLIKKIEEWAASVGCVRLRVWARKGWARELSEYKMTHVMLERELADGY